MLSLRTNKNDEKEPRLPQYIYIISRKCKNTWQPYLIFGIHLSRDRGELEYEQEHVAVVWTSWEYRTCYWQKGVSGEGAEGKSQCWEHLAWWNIRRSEEICSISSRSRVLAHRPCPKLEMFCPSVLQLFYGCSKVLMTNHGMCFLFLFLCFSNRLEIRAQLP